MTYEKKVIRAKKIFQGTGLHDLQEISLQELEIGIPTIVLREDGQVVKTTEVESWSIQRKGFETKNTRYILV